MASISSNTNLTTLLCVVLFFDMVYVSSFLVSRGPESRQIGAKPVAMVFDAVVILSLFLQVVRSTGEFTYDYNPSYCSATNNQGIASVRYGCYDYVDRARVEAIGLPLTSRNMVELYNNNAAFIAISLTQRLLIKLLRRT